MYGLFIMLMFFIALTIGLGFELGKKALNIDNRQVYGLLTVITLEHQRDHYMKNTLFSMHMWFFFI